MAGVRELNNRIQRAEVALDPRQLNKVLLDAVDLIRQRALENFRALPIVRDGKLRLPHQKHVEDVLISQTTQNPNKSRAWTKVQHFFAPQGIWLEFGHRIVPRGSKKLARKSKEAPHGETRAFPFFRPAVDQERENVRRVIEEGIIKLLFDSER